MSTGSFSDIKTTKVGTGGLNLLPSDKSQSPWIENLSMDTDGNWRPRHGLRLIRDFPDRICGLGAAYQAKSTIQKHYIYCVTEASKLYIGTVNTIGAAASVNFPTGGGADELATSVWSNEQKNGVFAVGNPSNPTSTEKLIAFAWPGVSAYDNPYVFEQDGTKLTSTSDIRGVPFSHGNTLCVIQKATLQWSTYGDAYTWPTTNYTYLPPEIGEGLAGMYWQEDVSYLFGTQGVCLAQGSPLEDSLRFRVLNAPPAVGGSGACITKCRDRIFYIAPGPTIFQVGGGLQRIDEPIQDYLKTYGDISNYQMFYDPLIDALCVSPYVSGGPNYTYLYSVSQSRWIGVYCHASNTRSISKAVNAGPKSNSDSVYRNTAPHAYVVAACGDLLSYYDPTLYGDETAAATTTTFTCAMESAPEGAAETPSMLKRILSVYVDGTGTWTVKLKHRTGGGSYTTVSLGSVAAPGWVHASLDVAAYQERIIRAEASVASGLKLKSLTIREMALGG